MSAPLSNKDCIIAIFDSFAKTVMKNECRDVPAAFDVAGRNCIYCRFMKEGQYSRLYITEGSVFGMEERKVQVLNAPAAVAPGRKQFTQEELQREYDYIRAEKLTRKLLDLGLITIEEFDKIMALNRESFSPALARIMP